MNTPLQTTDSSANQAAHQRPLFSRSFFANVITLRNEPLRFAKFAVAIVMNRGQRFSFFHAIADASVKFEADAVIDLVFLFLAATAERGQRDSKLLAVCSGDESASGTYYLEMQPRRGQAFRLVNDAFIAALQANPLSEFFECMAGANHGIGKAAAFFHALRSLAEIEHPRRKFEAQVAQIGGPAALENFDGLGDFIRMPGHAPQRLIHIGNQGHDFFAHALPRFDHDFGKPNRIFLLLHEGPGARFHIKDQRVNALGKLLAHDGSANQADIFDRGSDVPERINFFVGGSNLRGLPDQAHAAFAEDAAQFLERQIHVEARNRFQLVERAAGVAEAAPADHRDGKPARRHNGRKNQRSLVANPTSGVLVHFLAGNFGMVEDFSGVQHRFSERRELRAVHAANPHGHQPRGHLVVGYFAASVAGNQKIDFFAGEFPAITFLADQVDGAHAFGKRTASVTFALQGVNATPTLQSASCYSTCCTSGGRLVVWAETTCQPLGVLT